MVVLVIVGLIWRLLPDNHGFGFGGSPDRGAIDANGHGATADELRIEIRETAAESEARQHEILARYGDDPAARDWVANCVAQAAQEFTSSWEYACWRAWGDQHADPAG
jgi:hypothetical protein